MVAKNKKGISKNRKLNCSILKNLNISEHYFELPHKVKELIIEASWPKLSIDNTESKNFPEIDQVLSKIKQEIACCKLIINNQEYNLLDLSGLFAIDSVFTSLQDLSKKPIKNVRPKDIVLINSLKRFFDKIGDVTYKSAEEAWYKSGELLANLAWNSVSPYYRFDRQGLYFSFVKPNNKTKFNHCVSLKTFCPEKRVFNVDNKPRDTYLCRYFDHAGLRDLIIKEGVIGNIKPVKVYVQEHAINRIIERLKLNSHGDAFWSLSFSLMNPIVSKKHSDCYLMDFYYGSFKLGYLLVSLEEDAALVRTFKFITMFGTPEYFKLKKHLGGVREDFEYLGMDSLDLLNSDAFSDPRLKLIFKKCGLGHLFDIKSKVTFNAPTNLIANDIKKYFRIEVKNEN